MCVCFLGQWASLNTPGHMMCCVINPAPRGSLQDSTLRYETIWNISNCALIITCGVSSRGHQAAHDCPLISTWARLVSQPRVITLTIKTALWGAALLRAQGRVPSELPFTQNQQIKQYSVILNCCSLSRLLLFTLLTVKYVNTDKSNSLSFMQCDILLN